MKKLIAIVFSLALMFTIFPVCAVSAQEGELAVYMQDFTDIEKVRQDFSAYSVYDLGTETEYDTIDADETGSGYWYLNKDTDGSPQISRKNQEEGTPLNGSNGTKYIRILTFTRQKFVNFELEVDFKRGAATAYWAGIAIRQLNEGKYFLEDGAGIFCQQEGTTTVWGTDGVGGPHEATPIAGFQANAYHHLRVVCNGLTLEIYVDGVQTMTRTLPRTFFRLGYVSLVSVNNDSSYKNFSIKELPIDRLPEEAAQSPVPDAGGEDSLSVLAQLPPAERLPVSHESEGGADGWTVAAIITGCTTALAVAGVIVVLLVGRKGKKPHSKE